MHASIFQLDLGDGMTSRERWRAGRALAKVLAGIDGFIAFLAIETDDGSAAGLCVCMDIAALEDARRAMETWQRSHREGTQEAAPSTLQALVTGEVIVQRGF